MVERKVFKTKLCVLYQKGRCPRHNCSFAHGNAELRQSFGSYNGNRVHRGDDLRVKLDRRHSPWRKYSSGRDAQGSSPSRSFQRTGGKKRKKEEHFDGQNNYSGSLRSSDGAGDQVKRRESVSTNSRIALKEQKKEVQLEIKILDQQKSELRILIKEKDEEADVLASRIQELDAQLSKEKEECKRIMSKIKKFVKAHNRHVQAQEELKKSQDRFQRLGDQLSSGTNIVGRNEKDSSINVVSDGPSGSHAITWRNRALNDTSFAEKGVWAKHDDAEAFTKGTSTLRNTSGLETHHDSSKINKIMVMTDNENGRHQHVGNEVKQKKGASISASISSSDKLKGSGLGLLAPLTSMAAHAIDELVEIEVEENVEVVEIASAETNKGSVAFEVKNLPFLLPQSPPISQSTCSRYKGKDGNVDVEGPEEEEMEDVDII